MSSINLGRLQKADLRDAWASEAYHFTPWLAEVENLKLLGETIKLELELVSAEKPVGPFRADILCRDSGSDDHWVLIENQLERTDHIHLGQLLTYAAGLKAATIVWIAERFTDEHRAALDWLNEITADKFSFIGLELELWRIGDSAFAPKFNIVSKPNGWTKTIQGSVNATSGGVTEHQQRQLQFWLGFKEYMDEHPSSVKCTKPLPQYWMSHALGRSGYNLYSALSSWNSETEAKEPELRAEVVLSGKDSKAAFALLHAQKTEIENLVGGGLIWHSTEDAKTCRISLRRYAEFADSTAWPEQYEWLRARLETLHRVFSPLVKQLDTSKMDEAEVQEQWSGLGGQRFEGDSRDRVE